jgi:hypothetical protein
MTHIEAAAPAKRQGIGSPGYGAKARRLRHDVREKLATAAREIAQQSLVVYG